MGTMHAILSIKNPCEWRGRKSREISLIISAGNSKGIAAYSVYFSS